MEESDAGVARSTWYLHLTVWYGMEHLLPPLLSLPGASGFRGWPICLVFLFLFLFLFFFLVYRFHPFPVRYGEVNVTSRRVSAVAWVRGAIMLCFGLIMLTGVIYLTFFVPHYPLVAIILA